MPTSKLPIVLAALMAVAVPIVLLVILLSFSPEITVGELDDRIDAIKQRIRQLYPKIAYIIVQPDDGG